MDLHMYYTINVAGVNYFGSEIPEVEKIDGKWKLKQKICMEKDLAESEDHFTVPDLLLSENSMILTVIDLQVEPFEDEEVLIEYTLANPIPFKDVMECVVNLI